MQLNVTCPPLHPVGDSQCSHTSLSSCRHVPEGLHLRHLSRLSELTLRGYAYHSMLRKTRGHQVTLSATHPGMHHAVQCSRCHEIACSRLALVDVLPSR